MERVTVKRQRRQIDEGGAPETGAERTCALTRVAAPPERLIRFALAPDGAIVPDLERRLPGRGVWLTATREAVEKAVASKAFARSLKCPVVVRPDLPAAVDALMLKRLTEALALANKAGLVIVGFQQVDAALEKHAVAALLHGSDGAADGRGKLDRKFQAIQRAKGAPAPIIGILASTEIGLAMGRPSVVHAALIPGGLSDRILRAAERVERYRFASAGPGHEISQPNPNEG